MIVRLRIARWVLALAYTMATALTPCAHDHGSQPSCATEHFGAGSDDPHPRVTSHPESISDSDAHGCVACRFLNENQATQGLGPGLPPSLIVDASLSPYPSPRAGPLVRPTGRGPPLA